MLNIRVRHTHTVEAVILAWISQVYCQRFFVSGAQSRFFQVAPLLEPAVDRTNCIRAQVYEQIRQCEQAEERSSQVITTLHDYGLYLHGISRTRIYARSHARTRVTGKKNIVGFLLTPYFGAPLNPRFRQIRSVIKQRLFNVRNSLDIDGRPITYALTEPSIDPGALVALSAAGFDNASASAMVMGDRDSPLPRQRFDVLIHRALELCGEVRALGERLVNVIEKKETEAFGVLRANHATAILRMMYSIKETHMTEAQQTIDSLRLNRDSVVSQLAYYLASLASAWSDLKQDIDKPTQDDLRMSQHEQHEMNMATAAMALNVVSAGIDTLVALFCMVPSVSINAMPMGISTTVAAGGGSTISNFMQAGEIPLSESKQMALTNSMQNTLPPWNELLIPI
ncbi:hypothetical protein Aspvir_003170 [Aspergillus viridinutans]|uniref:Uncharacterized protein n=1 Tax=Aspergillus viridinutans TaxID=75553 RepID=A0A9P3C4B5_ASPVI|nr:uncharacterized protein Aspvir_003170 [Aspergillus viridinutans]GIK07504.1 hypothetical protein Aspvir_003170 [Aspergillus viridinutans]